MPVTKDQNGQELRTKLEPTFWVKLAGLMLAITSTAVVFGKWYVDTTIVSSIETHRLHMQAIMDTEVERWWQRESLQLQKTWRSEIREALLEHMAIPAHGDVTDRLNTMDAQLRTLERSVIRIETLVSDLGAGGK